MMTTALSLWQTEILGWANRPGATVFAPVESDGVLLPRFGPTGPENKTISLTTARVLERAGLVTVKVTSQTYWTRRNRMRCEIDWVATLTPAGLSLATKES